MSRSSNSSGRATALPSASRSYKHWASLAVTALIGLAATLAVYKLLVVRERELVQSRFQLDAKERALAVAQEFGNYAQVVQTLGAFYAGSKSVERDEFHAFTLPALERHGAIHALVWLPRVSDSERAAHEEGVRKEGLAEYAIRDRASGEGYETAPARDEYAPITFLEPSSGQEQLFGRDLRTNAEFHAAIERAYTSGKMTLTGATRWERMAGSRPIVAAVLPVYPSELRMPAGPRPQPQCVGFVAGVFPVAEVTEEALRRLTWADIDVEVLDLDAASDPQLLYTRLAGNTANPDEALGDRVAEFEFQQNMELAGRHWEVRCWPRGEYVRAESTSLPLGALVVGLMLTGVLSAYVANLVGRNETIESMVTLRTLQVREANAALVNEVEQRKQAEEALRQSEEQLQIHAADLERSNSDLQQFAYAVSHDLQEPLRAITGYCQLLQRRYADQLDANGKLFLQQSVEGALRMKLLIEDLLAYSRVGSRGQPFRKLNLETTLTQAQANLAVAITESGAKITHDALPEVVADGPQMTQLFQNLLGNAMKFHKPDEWPEIHVSARREGADWLVSVRDNGIGIAPEHFERIFQIFQRLHTREEYPGTGVGLAICKRIVERHRGRIWVESQLGAGAAFCFTLPCDRS